MDIKTDARRVADAHSRTHFDSHYSLHGASGESQPHDHPVYKSLATAQASCSYACLSMHSDNQTATARAQ